jgi:ABC-type cobalamin/Fe3+-siderophores transport system ATPase subunit
MDLYTKNVQNLSDGELQQVMIALALVRDTSFIILDEPTSFLDYKNREKIWNLLVALKNKGKGIIIASHDIFEIEKYADRITELK